MENQSGGNRPNEAPSTSNSTAWQGNSRICSPMHGGASESSSPRRRNDESWVEIASQPSSSSLSSIGDEIVTTGLRVGGGATYPPRRRRLSQQYQQHPQHPRQPTSMPQSYLVSRHAAHAGASSSQEEYEETESEEDRNRSSRFSTARRSSGGSPLSLGVRQDTAIATSAEDGDYDYDSDDGNSTALGRPSTTPVFTPQPNAFSHPPSHLVHRHSTPGSMSSGETHPYNNHHTRRSSYSRGSRHATAPHFMSPSYREDNDAALRASLTTLLSCAAAARGLSKRDEPAMAGPSSTAAALQPMGLRLVPEAELMSEDTGPAPAPTSGAEGGKIAAASAAAVPSASAPMPARPSKSSSPSSTSVSTSPHSGAREEKTKRSASGAAARGSSGRAAKKKRTSEQTDGLGSIATNSAGPTLISPSLLTWVVSAGVVVLVSVVGFGAGYVIGREVGRQEGAATAAAATANATTATAGSCGREIARSTTGGTLRRFRWGSMARSAAA